MAAAQARMAKEAASRAAFARGQLGLDRDGRHGRLGESGIEDISFDEYQRENRLNLESPMPPAREIAHLAHVEPRTPWTDGDPGYGPTYVFTDPDGHEFGVCYESRGYTPPADLMPALKNQAQAYPGHGVGVRRLDHVNYLGVEVLPNRDYLRDALGALVTEQIVLGDGTTAGSWTTFTNKGYDAVYTRDWAGTPGRLHRVAFATDTRADIIRAAERARGQAWGLKTIESFRTHGTPPAAEAP